MLTEQMPTNNNKRVAKNAVALTLRMVLVTIVGLFTSRIVLKALGVEDYGIYGVIGGVVGMASFLNASMAGATSRFITFELGHGDEDKLKKIFSTSLIIHIIIALVVAVLAETIGLWFVNNKMNFPAEKIFSVNILYQFSIISMIVGFTQAPYSSAIIAHEKMSIYAYFEIINVVLKLLIVYALLIVDSNRLIVYAGLMLLVSISKALFYRIYCIKHFKESKFKFIWDKHLLSEMLKFSGFDLYGNMCAIANSQGQPIILNMFFGVIANTGSSIAYTVTGAIGGLTRTIATAFKPQIVKNYANGNICEMEKLMRRSILFTLLAYSVIALPIYFETDKVIYLWLGQIPPYSVEFFRLIVISVFIDICIIANNAAIHATGNIKNISFVNGSLYLLSPIISYFTIHFWLHDATIVYWINILIYLFILVFGWYFIKIQIKEFNISTYIFSIFRLWLVIAISSAVIYIGVTLLRNIWIPENIFEYVTDIIIIGLVGCILLGVLSMKMVFNKEENDILRTYIKSKFEKLLERK